jgi:alanine dehydrogenase
MNIGIPKERRSYEFRVGMTPTGVQILSSHKHVCYVEHDAGLGAGFTDQEYERAGARIVYSPHEVFGRADLLLKVARPMIEEINWLRSNTCIAGLLHLSSAREDKIDKLISSQITAIALEQVYLDDGSYPVRRPLAQIGGLMAAQIAARLLQSDSGGNGILMGGVVGVPPAEVVIIGAGVVGTCAAQAFLGMGAHVTVLDIDLDALQHIYDRTPGIVTMISNPVNIASVSANADVLLGAVFVTGERMPVVVTREIVKSMKPRSIVLDLSIDEGGCVETSHPTTHDHPTFIEEGVIHYCVPNIPGVVARTSTHAFVNAAFPYIMEIANNGVDLAISQNPGIERAIQTHRGKMVHLFRLSKGKRME